MFQVSQQIFPCIFCKREHQNSYYPPRTAENPILEQVNISQGTGTYGRAHVVHQIYPEGMQPLWSPCWSRSWRNGAHEELHTGAGEKHMEEGAADRSCYGLISILSPCQGRGTGVGNKALKVSMRNKGVGERWYIIFWLCSSLPRSILNL